MLFVRLLIYSVTARSRRASLYALSYVQSIERTAYAITTRTFPFLTDYIDIAHYIDSLAVVHPHISRYADVKERLLPMSGC